MRKISELEHDMLVLRYNSDLDSRNTWEAQLGDLCSRLDNVAGSTLGKEVKAEPTGDRIVLLDELCNICKGLHCDAMPSLLQEYMAYMGPVKCHSHISELLGYLYNFNAEPMNIPEYIDSVRHYLRLYRSFMSGELRIAIHDGTLYVSLSHAGASLRRVYGPTLVVEHAVKYDIGHPVWLYDGPDWTVDHNTGVGYLLDPYVPGVYNLPSVLLQDGSVISISDDHQMRFTGIPIGMQAY